MKARPYRTVAALGIAVVLAACRTEQAPSPAAATAREAGTRAAAASHLPGHAEHGGAAHADGSGELARSGQGHAAPAGYASFPLERAQVGAAGLRLAAVEERPFARRVRTTGVVVLDETRTSHVHAKVSGWIEQIAVDFVGKSVRAGAPLCSIYSQEVLAAELEYLAVLQQTQSERGLLGSLASAEQQAQQQLISAARSRLALWDVPAREIERLERTRVAQRTFTLNAPRSGIVVAKQAVAGMFVDPSVELYLISDTSRLWLLADLYEADAAGVKLGDPARLAIQGQPGELGARVAFLSPTLEESTRTLKARFDLDNPSGALRPGAFGTVELDVELGRFLAVPEEAVIHAGQRAIVFVASGGQIEPRAVTLGQLVGGFYAVEQGLHAGEQVAVGAQFLIDSESRLRATSGKAVGHGAH